MQNIYEVFAELDSNKCITSVEGTAFHTAKELTEQEYIKIDEGSNGEMYGHCQPNYLRMKHGKTLTDEKGRYNFIYQDNLVVELTEEEKIKLNPPVVQEPTDSEKFDSRLTYLEIMTGVA